jgi:hypothetical protein
MEHEKSEELQRIEIASKTLSRIYEDLTYLNLNNDYYREVESVDITKLIEERMIYFSAMLQSRGLTTKYFDSKAHRRVFTYHRHRYRYCSKRPERYF